MGRSSLSGMFLRMGALLPLELMLVLASFLGPVRDPRMSPRMGMFSMPGILPRMGVLLPLDPMVGSTSFQELVRAPRISPMIGICPRVGVLLTRNPMVDLVVASQEPTMGEVKAGKAKERKQS